MIFQNEMRIIDDVMEYLIEKMTERLHWHWDDLSTYHAACVASAHNDHNLGLAFHYRVPEGIYLGAKC